MTESISIRPVNDRIVVEPIEQESAWKDGAKIHVPDNAKEKQQRGTVLAVGPGEEKAVGGRYEMPCSKGDEIVYGKYCGVEVTIDGRTVLIIGAKDVLGVMGTA